MKYYFYLDNILMPVTPSKFSVTQAGKSKIFDLAAGGEIVLPETPGLRQYLFSLLLPTVRYPFALYHNGYQPPEYYLKHLRRLYENAEPFDMVVIRRLNAETVLKFAARTLNYGSEEAFFLTGSDTGTVHASDARTILREGVSGKAACLFDTTEKVTIEDMTVVEDAEEYGDDFLVALKLRQYRELGTVKLKVGG
ncbi:MAG: hypothetical protein IJL26_09485 [Clostridia bacterium]|nr:hypothetical protein [Clostridia bacterium]